MTQLKTRRQTPEVAPPRRLARVFDEPIVAWRRLEAEPLDAAYYVSLAGGAERVLWINQRAPSEPKIGRYAAAMKLLPGFTAPLVCADTTLTRLEYPYLITGYLSTPTLCNVWPHLAGAARATAAAAWGEALRLVHHTRFELAGDLASPECQGVRLPDDLEALWAAPLRLAVKDYMLDTPKLMAALKRGLPLAKDAPITLTHGHPHAGAFLFDQRAERVVAALDFGNARRGDPMTDLAAIAGELRDWDCEGAFLRGYGALSSWDRERLKFYRLHHGLLQYALALTHLPNQLALRRLQLAEQLAERTTL